MVQYPDENPSWISDLVFAVTATFSAEPLVETVRFWLPVLGWPAARVQVSGYSQVFQDLTRDGLLTGRQPGANLLFLRLEDLVRDLPPDARRLRLDAAVDELRLTLVSFAARAGRPTAVVFCPPSATAPALSPSILAAESALADSLAEWPSLVVVRSREVTSLYPVSVIDDAESDRLGHIPFTRDFFAALGTIAVRRVRPFLQPPCKVVVVDADNTLWDGVVGEVGPAAVGIGPGRLALQARLASLKASGVLLGLASKNHPDDVSAVFARPEMVLGRKDFVAWKVNWAPKSENILALASDLDLALSSFVFLDDNPIECAEVAAHAAGVTALTVPAEADLPKFLDHVWAFDLPPATAADKDRTEQYRQQFARRDEQAAATSYRAFIEGLGLDVQILDLPSSAFDRAAQLTQRTNQFNVTSVRWTVAELSSLLSSGSCAAWLVRVRDRFGDYGDVGLVAYEVQGDAFLVRQFLLSCRVLGKGVEHRVFAALGEAAVARGLGAVVLPLRRTPRNEPVQRFLASVAGSYLGADDSYRMPSVSASAVLFDPDVTEPVAIASEGRPNTRADETRPDFQIIADALRTAEAVVAHTRRVAARPAMRSGRGRQPSTPAENILAAIWKDIFGVDEIGVEDDFFALGGDSVLGTQAIASANRQGLRLGLGDLFDRPMIRDLAASLVVGEASHEASRRTSTELTSDQSPVSPVQHGLLFQSMQMQGTGVAHEQSVYTIFGTLDVPRFATAWRFAIDRHPILRTTFAWDGNANPVQITHSEAPVLLERGDWQRMTPAEQERACDDYLRSDRGRPFDVTRLPLMRLALFQTGESGHALIWSFHHVILDGWSLSNVLGDVFSHYRGQAPSQPVPSYLEHISWLQRQDPAAAERYWRPRLAGFTAPTPLAIDRPVPLDTDLDDQTFAAETRVFEPAAVGDIRAFARANRLTLGTLVTAAWALLLARYSATEDVVFGCTVAGRPGEIDDVNAMVGLFINTLPLRIAAPAGLPALAWLKQVQQRVLELGEHQGTSLVAIQQWTDMPPGRALFDSIVVVENYPPPGDTGASITIEPEWSRHHTKTGYPLTLLAGVDEGLRLRVWFDTRRFDASSVRAMLGHLSSLLSAFVRTPVLAIGDLPLLSDGEVQQLARWNDTSRAYPTDVCLHELIEAQVARTPEALALRFADQVLTFRELDRRANQLARRLRRLGVGPSIRVALAVERSFEMVVGLVAVLKAGGTYVPIDPSYPADRIAFMLADAAAPVLLTQQRLLAALPEMSGTVVRLDADWSDIATESNEPLPLSTTASDPAYMIYTSGSTGRPKGALNAHRGIVNRLLWMQDEYRLTPADVVLQKTPFSFDVSVWEFFWPLMTGAELLIAEPGGHQNPEYLVRTIRQHGVTVLHFVPSMLGVFVEAPGIAGCLSLRDVMCSGEALPADLVRAFHARLPANLHNLYGPTEAAVDVTYWPCPRDPDLRVVPIGRPVANTQCHVLGERSQLVPVGVPGELFLGGVQVGLGYHNRPELTAEKFVRDPFSTDPGGRLYRTGDLCRWLSTGEIEYLGRLDHQVKIRGFRIELGEIEMALAALPSVSRAVVIAREDRPGDKRLVAYVVSTQSGAAPVEEWREQLSQSLPDYMVPAAFVVLDEIPLSPNGKVDRKALPAPAAGFRPGRTLVPPSTELERQIAEIWCQVLGVSEVGVDDNFFEVGGQSLKLMQVHYRIREQLKADIPIVRLFQHPTIAALARSLASEAVKTAPEQTDDDRRTRAARQREAAARARELTQGRRRP